MKAEEKKGGYRSNEQTVESGRATFLRAGRKRPATTMTTYSNALIIHIKRQAHVARQVPRHVARHVPRQVITRPRGKSIVARGKVLSRAQVTRTKLPPFITSQHFFHSLSRLLLFIQVRGKKCRGKVLSRQQSRVTRKVPPYHHIVAFFFPLVSRLLLLLFIQVRGPLGDKQQYAITYLAVKPQYAAT